MLLLYAVLVQAASPLPADVRSAAMLCRDATIVSAPPSLSTYRLAISAVYFAMRAAGAGGPDGFSQRWDANYNVDPARSDAIRNNAPAILAACARRFPASSGVQATPLPADALDRDLLCAGAPTILANVIQPIRNAIGGGGEYDFLIPMRDAYRQRLPNGRLQSRGINAANIDREMSVRLIAALDIGDLMVVSRACQAQLGPPPARN